MVRVREGELMSTKEFFKVSGKRTALPSASELGAGWKFIPRPGGWVVVESPTGERQRIMLSEIRGRLSASVGGYLWQGEVIRDQRASSRAGGDDSDLVAQFPGKVRKLLVAENAKVAEGEPLLLVEAMKMEFAVKAPFAGVVTKVLVKEGQQLSPGDRFVDMKPEGGNGG
jgi:biotin carboxyl carrier protein